MTANIAQKFHFKILRRQKCDITICKYAICKQLLKLSVDSSAPWCVRNTLIINGRTRVHPYNSGKARMK